MTGSLLNTRYSSLHKSHANGSKVNRMSIEGIIGKKVGMTQVFAEDGALVPVTVIQAGPCLVVQKKTADRDGYDAVHIALVEKLSKRRITIAQRCHVEKAVIHPHRTLSIYPCSDE